MPRNREKYIVKFNVIEYFKALDKELKKVTAELQEILVNTAKKNLVAIPFKHNLVKIRGARAVTDASRKQSVIDSVVAKELSLLEGSVMDNYSGKLADISYKGFAEFGTIQGRVTAMEEGNFRDTHIGIYYEFGTGENADVNGPFHLALKNWNPKRPKYKGSPIVTREKSDGDWVDLGGNIRYTTSEVGGRRTRRFIQNVGEDLHAYYWFLGAFKEVKKIAVRKYAEAVKRVQPFKFMKVNKNLVIGKKWS